MNKKIKLKSLDEFIDEHYGVRGTCRREFFEQSYEGYKQTILVQESKHRKRPNMGAAGEMRQAGPDKS